jgi:tetratricopeptide (TPR) repeat protein
MLRLSQAIAGEPPQDPRVELDAQQVALLEVLRGSGDQQASFAELRAAGVEFPASVAEELELLGLPLERCSLRRAGSSSPGVRLCSRERPGGSAGAPTREPIVAQRSRPPERNSRVTRPYLGRWVAPALLVAAFAAIVSLAALSGPRAGGRAQRALATRTAKPARPSRPTSAAGARRAAVRRRTARPRGRAPVAVAERPRAPLASELEARGHRLLESGQERAAAARLSEALAATGERTSECIEPASEACLTYAYALYDLGRALALEGRAAQAAAILEQRLRIDNQRATVTLALGALRAHTGSPASAPRPRHAHTDTRSAAAGGVAAPAVPTGGSLPD